MYFNQAKQGFTLIELLVVVLIIGILAAVALPQYQKAVEKAKSVEALSILKSVYQSIEEYHLANGTYPTSFEELSVYPPWTEKTKWYSTSEVKDTLSNKDWSLQVLGDEYINGLSIGRLSGNYTGGGFVLWAKYDYASSMPLHTILCIEKVANITTPGDYCQRVMQSGEVVFVGSSWRYYKM